VWLRWIVPGTCIAHYEQSESWLNEAESDMPTFVMVRSLYVGHDKGLGDHDGFVSVCAFVQSVIVLRVSANTH